MAKLSDCSIIQLPMFPDHRGNLSFAEQFAQVPFQIQRTWWLYDVPGGERRAGYALCRTDDMIIALSGSFNVILDDGVSSKTVPLNRSYFGLLIPRGIWHELVDFSTNSLALVLSSDHFDPDQYIRDYETFRKMKADGRI